MYIYIYMYRGPLILLLLHDYRVGGPPEVPLQFVVQCSSRAGIGFLDAPVTGAPARAAAGTLTTMVPWVRRISSYSQCSGLRVY